MIKKSLDKANLLYPTPTTLVGSIVDGRPNFITIAHVGIVNASPPHLITLGMGRRHHSNAGIREHQQFSVNIPSEELIVETDYCGIVTGRKADKGALFELFYGELDKAPMIRQCPLNMACRLERVVETDTHDLFIGEVVESLCDEEVLTRGKVDLSKVCPLLFDMSTRRYFSVGKPLADCWSVGKQLKPKG